MSDAARTPEEAFEELMESCKAEVRTLLRDVHTVHVTPGLERDLLPKYGDREGIARAMNCRPATPADPVGKGCRARMIFDSPELWCDSWDPPRARRDEPRRPRHPKK